MIRNFLRIISIIRTLNTHGALYLIRHKVPLIIRPFIIKKTEIPKGDALKEAIHHLGPSFVKLGQMLSTREDLVGNDMCKSLESLQDSMPRVKEAYADNVIKKNFKKDNNHLFSHFEHEAVASASIAEVFKARTVDGKDVAVKIIKPDIKNKINKDISLFKSCAKIFMFFSSEARRLRLDKVVESFQEFIYSELDLCIEAATISRIKEIHASDDNIYTPEVFWEYTSNEVLTMEWIDGVKVNNLKTLKPKKIANNKLASSIILMFFKQALEYGYFHADLHPGNILIQKDGKITLLDYGIIGHLSEDDRRYIAEILYGFMKKDYEYVAKIHFDAGYVPESQSLFQFTQACRAIGEPIIGMPADKISVADMLTRLLDTTKKFKMETQPQLLLLQKTMVMAEGLAKKICPEINLWDTTRPFLENWAKDNLTFDSKAFHQMNNFKKDYNNLSEFIKLGLKKRHDNTHKYFIFLLSSNLAAILLLIYLSIQ